jgi:hypothetical protein
VVTIPLAPRTARAIDLAIDERTERPALPQRRQAATGPAGRRPDRPAGHPPRRDQQACQPAHPQARFITASRGSAARSGRARASHNSDLSGQRCQTWQHPGTTRPPTCSTSNSSSSKTRSRRKGSPVMAPARDRPDSRCYARQLLHDRSASSPRRAGRSGRVRADHELPLIASLEPRGVVLWSSIQVATAVLAAVRVQAEPPYRWHVYGLAASPAGWGAEPASGVSSRYLIS